MVGCLGSTAGAARLEAVTLGFGSQSRHRQSARQIEDGRVVVNPFGNRSERGVVLVDAFRGLWGPMSDNNWCPGAHARGNNAHATHP